MAWTVALLNMTGETVQRFQRRGRAGRARRYAVALWGALRSRVDHWMATSNGGEINLLSQRSIVIMFIRTLHQFSAMILAAAAVLLTAACEQAPPEPQIDWEPPAFELADADGKTFRYPDDLEGPAIVLFWASWCPYCKALMPHLQSIVDESGGTIEVLALNFRDDGNPLEFITEYGYDFRLFLASDAVAESWGVKGTPGLFLVDSAGRAVFSNHAIPKEAYPKDPAAMVGEMKHYQKAARRAPVWASELRKAIDRTLL